MKIRITKTVPVADHDIRVGDEFHVIGFVARNSGRGSYDKYWIKHENKSGSVEDVAILSYECEIIEGSLEDIA